MVIDFDPRRTASSLEGLDRVDGPDNIEWPPNLSSIRKDTPQNIYFAWCGFLFLEGDAVFGAQQNKESVYLGVTTGSAALSWARGADQPMTSRFEPSPRGWCRGLAELARG